VLELTIINEKL